MPKRVLVFDTSILCCLLEVPGKETAGPDNDQWTKQRIDSLIATELASGSTFVLPLATLIETGNHIAQAASMRFECAKKLAEYIQQAAEGSTPWAAFTEQSKLWDSDSLRDLAGRWPPLAAKKHSMGDAMIVGVAQSYAEAEIEVVILTGDTGLKAYEPTVKALAPRRRR